jgi:integrase
MVLTEALIRSCKPLDMPYKTAKEQGLFLLINPNGSRLWRQAYVFGGKEKLISLGPYPEISLKDARERRDENRRLLARGLDPSMQRQQLKSQAAAGDKDSFGAIGAEWLQKYSSRWTESHKEKIKARLDRDVFPWLGKRLISEITASEVLAIISRIHDRGTLDTAHRAMQNCAQIFRYAIATGRKCHNVVADLRGALPPNKPQKHFASVTDPKEIGHLLSAIRGYSGNYVTRCALQFAPLTFVRPTELRHAEWKEFDLEGAEWKIPADKMKMSEPHIVPLSTQAVAILQELKPLTERFNWVFPAPYNRQRPMSENAVLTARRRMGYTNDQMTGHGFRSMASTRLNEMGWNRDAIERQLAHGERALHQKAFAILVQF